MPVWRLWGKIQRIIIEDLDYEVEFCAYDSLGMVGRTFFLLKKRLGQMVDFTYSSSGSISLDVLRLYEDLEKTSRLVRWKLKEPSTTYGLNGKKL